MTRPEAERYGDIIVAALDDPYLAMQWAAGYREPTATNLGTYDLLRRMAGKAIIASIIETRCTQIAEFARRTSNPRSPGFQIVLRDSRRPMTAGEREEAERLGRWLETCGDWSWAMRYPRNRVYRERLTFETWIRCLLTDSLRYDQATTQIILNRVGKPLAFLPIDAATMRINTEGSGYTQVVAGQVVANFEAAEIGFGVRRSRTDIDHMGYGHPELLDLIEILTAFLWGFQYNVNYFRQGLNTKGLLVISGPMNPEQFQTFRRDFQAMAMGVEAAHRVPVLNMTTDKSAAQWISLQRAQADMEYREWMNWLMKVVCALYLIDPAEIGFQFGAEGQRGAVFQSNPEARVQIGRDKGMRPLLRTFQTWINRWLIWRLNPEFSLEFHGLDDFAERERAAFDRERVQSYMTVDEVRAEHQLPPLPGGLGRVPASPAGQQAVQLALMNGAIDLQAAFGRSQTSNEAPSSEREMRWPTDAEIG